MKIREEIKLINSNTGFVIKNLNINKYTHFCLSYDENPIGNDHNVKVISFECWSSNYVDVWNLFNGERLHQLEHESGVECIKCLTNNRLITGTVRGLIKIWDLLEGQCQFSLFSHKSAVFKLDTVPNEADMFISGNENGIIRIWDLKKPKEKCVSKILIRLRFKLIKALTQGLLACADYALKICIWDYKTRKCVITLHGHTDYINDLEFSPSENWLLSCSNDKTIRIWSMSTFECVQVLVQFECIEKIHLINRLSHSRQMPYVNSSSSLKLLTSEKRCFNIWDLSTNECVESYPLMHTISQFNVCPK